LTTLPTHLDQWKEGVTLLVDKPLHWTSFDVVNKLRYTISRKVGKLKVGHAGTLDPLATGLLIVCTGKMTKQIDTIQAEDKTYIGTIKLGATTASYDSEMPEENIVSVAHISLEKIREVLPQFLGAILQTPPVFSAIKIDGKKSYNLARKDKAVELPQRSIVIDEYNITSFNSPFVEFEIKCSKGTYIRSLAHDLGQALGVGGYLTKLIRTQSGDYKLSEGNSVSDLVDFIEKMEA
jgi:tRNA pseudouridine55 synthase